ncbi:hypothetical protein [Nocardia sp. NPDC052566]|uniref:hypothetical protein n=1 Tax=Nocardia sp. NPDC052566 TaxID=3364330 RepID=UPI0037C949D3
MDALVPQTDIVQTMHLLATEGFGTRHILRVIREYLCERAARGGADNSGAAAAFGRVEVDELRARLEVLTAVDPGY